MADSSLRLLDTHRGVQKGVEDGMHSDGHPGQVSDLTLTGAVSFAWLYQMLSLHHSCPLPGRAEGRSPSAFFSIPQEWGTKGVE
jgi:hypothetical protein